MNFPLNTLVENSISYLSYTFDNLSGTVSPNLESTMTSNMPPANPAPTGSILVFINIIVIALIICSIGYSVFKYKKMNQE